MRSDGIECRTALTGLPLFSYGFRPFFLGAALFAGLAVPAWVLMASGLTGATGSLPARDWHVHEMVFGFLPAVIAGFLLTAVPNWTDRPPLTGVGLMLLSLCWVVGRVAMAVTWLPPMVSALLDGLFLVALAGWLWRQIVASASWNHAPIGVLLTLYACGNLLFHALVLNGSATDLAARVGVGLDITLLVFIGGRLTPNFSREFLIGEGSAKRPAAFTRFDAVAIGSAAAAALVWVLAPQALLTGWALLAAGLVNLMRLLRWYGWLTWREPLVLVLHVGYSWLVLALLLVGGATLRVGLQPEDAIHALTTGAVGVMTLAVMTRASLGHTGRPRHAGPVTVGIYLLVFVGATLRVFGPATGLPSALVLGSAATFWSGGYVLFALAYGPFLLRPSLDE